MGRHSMQTAVQQTSIHRPVLQTTLATLPVAGQPHSVVVSNSVQNDTIYWDACSTVAVVLAEVCHDQCRDHQGRLEGAGMGGGIT